MQKRVCSETEVTNANCRLEPANSRPKLSALPAELWHPLWLPLSALRKSNANKGSSGSINFKTLNPIMLRIIKRGFMFVLCNANYLCFLTHFYSYSPLPSKHRETFLHLMKGFPKKIWLFPKSAKIKL